MRKILSAATVCMNINKSGNEHIPLNLDHPIGRRQFLSTQTDPADQSVLNQHRRTFQFHIR